MYIHLKDQDVFAMAGLWEVWHNPEGDEVHTFTIITTDANDFMAPIHNRMPVILHKSDYDSGLSRRKCRPTCCSRCSSRLRRTQMTAYEVSRAVNTPIDRRAGIDPASRVSMIVSKFNRRHSKVA